MIGLFIVPNIVGLSFFLSSVPKTFFNTSSMLCGHGIVHRVYVRITFLFPPNLFYGEVWCICIVGCVRTPLSFRVGLPSGVRLWLLRLRCADCAPPPLARARSTRQRNVSARESRGKGGPAVVRIPPPPPPFVLRPSPHQNECPCSYWLTQHES